MRDKLIKLIKEGNGGNDFMSFERIADYLLENGVIVPPIKMGWFEVKPLKITEQWEKADAKNEVE